MKAQEFLALLGLEPETIQTAKKEPLDATQAIALVRRGQRVSGAKGSKLVILEISQTAPSDEEIAALIVGPSGNLRAPTLQIKNSFVVGFSDELYRSIFNTRR